MGLAHTGVLDARSQRTLGEIAFFVASPALMVTTISRVEIDGAATNLLASATALGATFTVYAAIARLRWRLDGGSVLIGSLASSYVNAGNLGLAIAAYVVGDITVVVPTLLVQMLVVQPIALVALDRHTGRGAGEPARCCADWSPTRSPIAALLGLVLAITGWTLPEVVDGAAPPAGRRRDPADADVVRRGAATEPAARTGRAQPRGRGGLGAQARLHAGRRLAGRDLARPRRDPCCSASC